MELVDIPAPYHPDLRREGVDDPSLLGFPPLLPVELALQEVPRRELLVMYGFTPETWDKLRQNPAFQKAVLDATEMLQREGMTFRVKARMQAEELLQTSWHLIHNKDTPAAVKADLIKHTWKVAGVEPKETANLVTPLQININL